MDRVLYRVLYRIVNATTSPESDGIKGEKLYIFSATATQHNFFAPSNLTYKILQMNCKILKSNRAGVRDVELVEIHTSFIL